MFSLIFIHVGIIHCFLIRCTEIKVAVKFLFFTNLTPLDREFQGGQKYVCLAFSLSFFPVEK
jgi:hypothetical protein